MAGVQTVSAALPRPEHWTDDSGTENHVKLLESDQNASLIGSRQDERGRSRHEA